MKVPGDPAMWIEKLSIGVLRVLTPLGARYLNPSVAERLYLLWVFRNFKTLPLKVLSTREQRRIEAMCACHGFVSVLGLNGMVDTPLLGTLEQRPRATNPTRPSQSDAVSPFAADCRGAFERW